MCHAPAAVAWRAGVADCDVGAAGGGADPLRDAAVNAQVKWLRGSVDRGPPGLSGRSTWRHVTIGHVDSRSHSRSAMSGMKGGDPPESGADEASGRVAQCWSIDTRCSAHASPTTR